MARRIIPVAEQHRRAAELDAIRATRALTDAERAEADNLSGRIYMREYRKGGRKGRSAPCGCRACHR